MEVKFSSSCGLPKGADKMSRGREDVALVIYSINVVQHGKLAVHAAFNLRCCWSGHAAMSRVKQETSKDVAMRAGSEDLREIIEDLGTLSTLPMPRKGDASQRWRWLKPWRFISGLGWRGTRLRGTVELSIQIRGDGLENCSSVRV